MSALLYRHRRLHSCPSMHGNPLMWPPGAWKQSGITSGFTSERFCEPALHSLFTKPEFCRALKSLATPQREV